MGHSGAQITNRQTPVVGAEPLSPNVETATAAVIDLRQLHQIAGAGQHNAEANFNLLAQCVNHHSNNRGSSGNILMPKLASPA